MEESRLKMYHAYILVGKMSEKYKLKIQFLYFDIHINPEGLAMLMDRNYE